jgi:hypothetical protein
MNTTSTATGTGAGHLSPQTIAAYFADTLSDAALADVELHVAQCDHCALASQQALALGEVTADRLTALGDFVDSWSAAAHGQAAVRSLLLRGLSLARARSTVAALRDRLAAWEQRWNGQVEAAVRVILDAPGQAARVLTDGLQELTRPSASWQFAPAPAAIPTRGAVRHRGTPQPVVVAAASADGPSARVAVSGERGEVTVRVDGVPAGGEPPLVLLLPIDHGQPGAGQLAAEPRLAVLEPSPGSDAWIARFDGLGPGEYVVAFEPLS